MESKGQTATVISLCFFVICLLVLKINIPEAPRRVGGGVGGYFRNVWAGKTILQVATILVAMAPKILELVT